MVIENVSQVLMSFREGSICVLMVLKQGKETIIIRFSLKGLEESLDIFQMERIFLICDLMLIYPLIILL